MMAQHKRVVGQNSDPREAILSDLLKLIVKIHQKNHHVVLGIDANETCKQDGTPPDNATSKFCSEAGLVDTIHEIHGQSSCDKSSGTPIDFMFVHLHCCLLSEWECYQGMMEDHRTIERLGSISKRARFGGEPSLKMSHSGKAPGRRTRRKHRSTWPRYTEEQRSV